MIELYKKLSYGHKISVCKDIANKLYKQPTSVRNWFISFKKIPIEHEQIVLIYLELETIKMNISFMQDPEMLFEMNRKYRELYILIENYTY